MNLANLNQIPLPTTSPINSTYGHLHFGDKLENKSSTTTRLYLQNINGCKLSHSTDWEAALLFLQNHNIDVVGQTETRTKWDSKNYTKVKQKLNKHLKHNLLSTSHCTSIFTDGSHPGGTATIMLGKVVTSKIQDVRDTTGLGRWSGYSIQLPSNQLIYVITAYRPNADSKHGTNTTYQQQLRLLQSQGINNANPRQQILQDLTIMINNIHTQNNFVILMWDTNESLGGNTLNFFQSKTKLVSLMGSSIPMLSTYSRGTQTIDHIFGSPAIKEKVTRFGYLPFYEGGWMSDHRALFLDLDLSTSHHQSNVISNPRLLHSKNTKGILRFLNHISKQDIINLHSSLKNLEKNNLWGLSRTNPLPSLQHLMVITIT
jgi:exonuclease III